MNCASRFDAVSETRIQRVRAHEAGVSLIELMVALVIGLFLIVGAISVNQQARNAYRTTEAVSRVQETARYAFDVLEPEVRMANYWGFNSRADYIEERATDGQAEPASLGTFDAQLDYCGDNFAINIDDYLDGSDNTYGLSCDAFGTASGVSDVLVVRRAAENNSSSIVANRVYLQTSRLRGTLFVPDDACADVADSCDEIPAGYAPPQSRTHQLLVSAYYVSQDSTGRPGSPSLRRKRLAAINGGNAAAVYPDEEIVPGVEDLQVRFGVDTNGDTNIDQYVDPGGVAAGDAVISATIWLRVRAEEPDYTYTDTNTYQYADMGAAWAPDPDADEDHFRRIVVSKTLQLRNTRR
jgi:type IV pilus assembly protein PilW